MKKTSVEQNLSVPVFRAAGSALFVAMCVALGGCAAPKTFYPGAQEQQQRSAAEAAATPAAGAANTQGTYLKLIEQMQRDDLWFASLAHIDQLEQRWGVVPASTRLRADALRHTAQTEQSRKMYSQLMGTPLEGAAYHGLGLLAASQSDFAGAQRLLEQARLRNPADGLLLSDLGYAALRAGEVAQARIPLMQAIQLKPDSAQVQANVALYLELSGQPDQAAALMDAHKFPLATRTAIRDAARQLGASPSRPLPGDAEPGLTLTLKLSDWRSRAPATSRANAPPGPAAIARDAEFPKPTLTAGGQP